MSDEFVDKAVEHHPGHGDEGEEHQNLKGTYITIWLTLAFLTLVEVVVPQVYDAPWNLHTRWILLVLLASGKALLVALYFMHLKWETPWLKRIALMPAYMGIFTVLLMVESVYRGVAPQSD